MTDWAIPQQAKLKYTQLFNLHDRSHSGSLSGLQCRDILLQSGLPRNILAEIWNLSDIDGDGQLTREEFILAMHLTNNVRSGQALPNELPKDLIPPSYRRTRSISQSSVNSATSAGSSSITNVNLSNTSTNVNNNSNNNNNNNTSGNNNNENPPISSQKPSVDLSVIGSLTSASVLNSNSFEDKRRENFEKGRAELERRRLKIIEQQMSILNEQSVAGKKALSEAKAKIDALRADRDSKMGMITFLEAQLKTLQDKKAYLNQEELSLIAIAKDLNLVNDVAAQAKLDQLATEAKQQSINEMKEKLKELIKVKEEKSKELSDVKLRLEGSKAQLKSVSELATITYETYRKKVANAKAEREKFLAENKNQVVDLDSAWGSASSFKTAATSLTTDQSASRLHDTTTTTTATSTTTSTAPKDDPWSSNGSAQLSSMTAAFSTAIDNNNSTADSFSNFTKLNDSYSSTKAFDASTTIGNGFDSLKITNEPSPVKRYTALYAFEARNPDELTIEIGDTIIGSEHVCEPGWLFGERNGHSGLFPEAYVQRIVEDESNVIQPSPPKLEPLSQINILPTDAELTQSNPSSLITDANSTSSSSIKYKVIYAFDARNPDELTIKPGDIITGMEEVTEPGWLCGRLNGQKGLFPEAYVQLVAATEASQDQSYPEPGTLQRMSSVGSLRSKKSRSKSKAEVATVIANYRALGNEQLNLEKGQLVLIRRKTDSGWWQGELQIKGKKKQFGWFPASYVKLLSNNSLDSSGIGGTSAGAIADATQ